MIKMVALICALGTSPDACTLSAAASRVDGPVYHDADVCELHSRWFSKDPEVQQYARRIEPSGYLRLICISELLA